MKRLEYIIKIGCDIDGEAVIPSSCSTSIEDETGKVINMITCPSANDIMDIWIGKSKSYPKLTK